MGCKRTPPGGGILVNLLTTEVCSNWGTGDEGQFRAEKRHADDGDAGFVIWRLRVVKAGAVDDGRDCGGGSERRMHATLAAAKLVRAGDGGSGICGKGARAT